MSRIIKQDLGPGAFKRQTGQRLNVTLKENIKKSRRLLLYSKRALLRNPHLSFGSSMIVNNNNDRENITIII